MSDTFEFSSPVTERFDRMVVIVLRMLIFLLLLLQVYIWFISVILLLMHVQVILYVVDSVDIVRYFH